MEKSFLKRRAFLLVLAVLVFASLVFLSIASGWLVELLWMSQLGYQSIFWRLLSIKMTLFGLGFIIVFLYFWINLRLVLRNSLRFTSAQDSDSPLRYSGKIPPGRTRAVALVLSLIFALIFGLILNSGWDTYLRFHWGGSFGQSDPIFHLNIGFYVFRLPFYELIQNSLAGLTFIVLLITFLAYVYVGALQFGRRDTQQIKWPIAAIRHLSIILLLFLAAWGWGYYLDRFQLLYSTRGVVCGAGYTDVHVVRIGLWIMLFASVVLGIFVVYNLLMRRLKVIRIGVGSYFALLIVILVLLPAVIQKFKVQPNELELETSYLRHNIDFTRKAYLLDRIEKRDYRASADLTIEEISQNEDTLRNIRLWDWRPIRQTFRQTQEIRLYYHFCEVDVDRYYLQKKGYRQVMLSARELAEKLPPKARTWVNERLQYTHGYGLAMSLVSEKVEEGLPRYIVKDLPPVAAHLTVDRPAIYYGEKMSGYRIVRTEVNEFDYPRGDENVYTSYEGARGIPVNSVWKRILFAWHISDVNILLSSYITPASRIQLWRRVEERVRKIAPFLQLDSNPYLVTSGGRLFWIQDAYTVSSNFPYAEPYKGGLNYIRNSAKVVVDAYEGSVMFYVMDPDDPVLWVYRRAFPGVFKELGELPQDLRSHLRYPRGLFAIQVDKFRTYHMTIPQVFYNQEDLWTRPQEKYADSPIQMEPYYILMRLPGEKDLQYLIMTSLTPQNRDNMIAWVAAKSDFPDYGNVVVYKLPKERLIYGPVQIEAMIEQDDVISQQLSLWDQRGSKVIRGNLLVIPVNHSFLYVEPVYLIAEQTNIPQLKRVIVVYGKRVVMEETLEKAIKIVFGAGRPEVEKAPMAVHEALSRAREQLRRAEEAVQREEWIQFGNAMESLKQLLEQESERGKP